MKKAYKKLLCGLLVFSLVLVSFTACGGGGKVAGSGSAAASGGSGAGAAATGNTAGGTTITDTTIRIGVAETPDIDPALSITNSGTLAMANLYDGLVFPTYDGGIEPRLAESWSISEDGLTYTFNLRQGINFHDGSEMKASDVKFSMDRMLTIGEGYAYLYVDTVESTEVLGDYQVAFHLKKPYGPFVSSLVRFFVLSETTVMANIAAEGPYGEFGDYGKDWLLTHDAGTGAYVAKELVQQSYFHAEKFDDWFMGWEGRENAPTSMRLMAVPEPATVRTMMNNKEMEITDQWQSAENLSSMAEMEGVKVASYSTLMLQNMYMNSQKPPMDDVNFRRGIASLLNYDTIVNNIFIGSIPATGPVSAGLAGHVDTNVPTFNVEKAKEYFAQSKYANELADYPIEMLIISEVPDLEKVALMFQATASEVGIAVEISKSPWVSIIERVATAESTPHMLSANSAPAFNDAGIYLATGYSSETMGTWENCDWLANEELDKMLADSFATVDDAERYAKYGEIQNYIVDDLCATAYLCDLTERVAYQSSYVTWPFVDEVANGEVPSALYGFVRIVADMEIFPDKK